MESQGSPHFYLAESNGCTQTKVGEPHSGRICRTDWPSGDKTMGGHGQNNQPRRKSLELSLLPSRPKMRGSLSWNSTSHWLCHALLGCRSRVEYSPEGQYLFSSGERSNFFSLYQCDRPTGVG